MLRCINGECGACRRLSAEEALSAVGRGILIARFMAAMRAY